MIVDSWAWIEFLKKTESGIKVKGFLLNNDCYTCLSTLAEIADWAFRNGLGSKIEGIKNQIKFVSTLIDLDEDIAMIAGEINYQRKKTVKNWGMMDSFVLATANVANLRILTGDKQYEDLTNVEML